MKHLEVSFTLAYIPVIELAHLGNISGSTSDVFRDASFVSIFFLGGLCMPRGTARPEPVTAAWLVEHLMLPSSV